ncbi:MAG: sigma-70 family RNA polymerase sigma factor [Bacilli bacterium]|nr:sigma-70 family RNA polymerase sigma factor [Acholeplasmataceae bacterium]MDY2901974.1 sigma-70 family RNA polymerase sigma factor [Bacilli bacterium]
MKLEVQLKRAIKKNNIVEIERVFEAIYNTYFNLICFVINKYVNNKLDVEELANETFLNFYNRIFFVTIKDIKYYLITIAKNEVINYYNDKHNRYINYCDVYNSLIDDSSGKEYLEIIMEMERFLNEEEINIILLCDIYGYTFKEISQKYNKKATTIKTTYYRAIKKFRGGINDEN